MEREEERGRKREADIEREKENGRRSKRETEGKQLIGGVEVREGKKGKENRWRG